MELLEGKTLREELSLARKLEPSRVLQIIRETCGALDAAHQRQLIHRDVKPENLFLTAIGTKVLDFGIAKFLPNAADDAATQVTAQTRTGFIIGTPAYMSPEQLLGESADVSWDLWAIGIVVYESLTGRLPFPNISQADWRRAVLSGDFAATDHWDSFFKRVFAPERNKRPQSALELVRSLESAL
jgi:serine/threonine-protein kinase